MNHTLSTWKSFRTLAPAGITEATTDDAGAVGDSLGETSTDDRAAFGDSLREASADFEAPALGVTLGA